MPRNTARAEAEVALSRCAWCGTEPLYVAYHDDEWGVPSHDDRHLFEMLILEGAQAGLSWSTILRKRENYRRAFAGFDPPRVARFTQRDVERLMGDAGVTPTIERSIAPTSEGGIAPTRITDWRVRSS